jgi:hypothetical protein
MTLRRCSPRDNNRPQANWRWVLVVCQQKMVPTNVEQRPNEHPLIVVAEVATPHRLSGPVGLYPLAAFDNHIVRHRRTASGSLSRISPSSSFAGFAMEAGSGLCRQDAHTKTKVPTLAS